MTMANEMTQSAGAAVTAQRLKAVAAIGPALRQQLNASRSARRVEVDELMASIRSDMASLRKDLDGIFSETAVIRGRSVDLMQTFARERRNNAEALRKDLENYMSGLETSVANLLRDYSRARDEMCIRGMDAREAFLKEVRRTVQTLLQDAEKTVRGFSADRARTGRPPRAGGPAGDKPRHAPPGKPAPKPATETAAEKAEPAAAKVEPAVPEAARPTEVKAATEAAKMPAPAEMKSAVVKTTATPAPAAESVAPPARAEAKPAVAKTPAAPTAPAQAKTPAPASAGSSAAKAPARPAATAGKTKAPRAAAQTTVKKTVKKTDS